MIHQALHPIDDIVSMLHEKNYRGITLTFIAAKIYNAQPHNRVESKIEKIFRNDQKCFRCKQFTSQILILHRILKGVRAKYLEAALINRLLQSI